MALPTQEQGSLEKELAQASGLSSFAIAVRRSVHSPWHIILVSCIDFPHRIHGNCGLVSVLKILHLSMATEVSLCAASLLWLEGRHLLKILMGIIPT